MNHRAASLTTSRLLSGRPVYTSGRLLADDTRETPVLLDPDTGDELAPERMPAFILSTEGEASDGHVVMQEWDLSRASTVGIPILWAHNAKGDVLGQWRDISVRSLDTGRDLVGRADFDTAFPLAADRAGQVRRGYIRAVSIGWQPGATVRRSELPREHPRYAAPLEDECGMPAEGLVMGTPEQPNRLFETSLVPVPADAGAFNIERTIQAAERALAGSMTAPDTRDLDAILAAVAGNPAARAWIMRHIDRLVSERMADLQPPAPKSPARRPGTVRFLASPE